MVIEEVPGVLDMCQKSSRRLKRSLRMIQESVEVPEKSERMSPDPLIFEGVPGFLELVAHRQECERL